MTPRYKGIQIIIIYKSPAITRRILRVRLKRDDRKP